MSKFCSYIVYIDRAIFLFLKADIINHGGINSGYKIIKREIFISIAEYVFIIQ